MALRDKIVFTSTCCLVSFYLGTQYAEASTRVVPTITNVSTPVPELNIPNTSVPQLSVNYKYYNKETKLYSYATKCTGRNPNDLSQCIHWSLKKEYRK